MGRIGGYKKRQYLASRWKAWFSAYWAKGSIGTRELGRAIVSNCDRKSVPNGVVSQWLGGRRVPEPDMAFAVGEAFRSLGHASDGISALFGAGRYIEVARLLRELAVVDPEKAVQTYCRLPYYFNWIEVWSNPDDAFRRMTGAPINFDIVQLRRDRYVLFDYNAQNDAWQLVDSGNTDMRDKPPRYKAHSNSGSPRNPIPILGNERAAWILASQAIKGSEVQIASISDERVVFSNTNKQDDYDFYLRRHAYFEFNEIRKSLWYALLPWASTLVGNEALLSMQMTPIADPKIARDRLANAIRQSPQLRVETREGIA